MTFRSGFALAAVALFLTGCATAPQRQIPINTTSLSPSTRIGVVMTALPPVNTSLPGAGCLLCLAAAEIANANLTTHAKTLPYEGVSELDKAMAAVLAERGLSATVIPERVVIANLPKNKQAGPDRAPRSFTALGQKHNVDKLLVIELNGIGFLRTYNNYFPTSDPKAWVRGVGYIVDVKTNTYDWYLPIEIQKASAGGWDEPPKFPGLTNAYFQAIELTLDSYLNPFRLTSLATQPAPAPAAEAVPAASVAPEAPAAPAAPATPAAPAAEPVAATTPST